VIEDKRLAGKSLRKTLLSVMTLILLLTNVLAFADFSSSESRTLGVGRIQSASAPEQIAPAERLVLPASEVQAPASGSSGLATPIERDLAVRDVAPSVPGPSVNPGDGNYDSIPWRSGLASAYGDDPNEWTALGIHPVTQDSMAVAVPVAWSYLLGRTIEIEYNGIVVTALINDTGPFAIWGRDLDLQPGVWKAFGFESTYDWGVRTVRYRVIY